MISFILNGSIAFLLILYIFYKKDLYTLFFSLFLYITLHYSYSAIAIFWPNKVYILRASTQMGAKITGIGFLLFIITILTWRYRRLLIEQVFSGASKVAGLSCFLWFLVTITHWIIKGLNNEFPTQLTIQNIFSTCLLCILIIGFGAVFSRQPHISKKRLEKLCDIIAILISLIVLIATYEIIALHAWCGAYKTETGEYVWRASSILFNPNLLGFWCALVILFSGYVYHMKSVSRKLPILIIILCSLAIFLSGSRSSFLICFFPFSLITIFLFFQKKNRLGYRDIFLPLGAFVASILAAIIIVKIGITHTNYEFACLNPLSLLADRFVFMPVEIMSFVLDRIPNYIEVFPWLTLYLSKASAISIHGRFSTGLVDNGYLVMLEDTGWIGLIIWIFIWIYLIYIGIKVLRISPGIRSIYALSILLGCAFSAMFIRAFQVFPFWVMIAMALGLSLSWFQIVLAGNFLCEYSSELD